MLTTTIGPNAEDCFYENIEMKNNKVKFQFQVSSGGFMDIDVFVYNPENEIIHEVKKKNEGKFTFNADKRGAYKFCFSNKMSTLTPKSVQFVINVGDILDPNLAKLETLDPIEKAIMRLSEGLGAIQQQQQFLRERESQHRDLIEETNSRVMIWSIFQLFALVGMSVWQIFYLKRLFSKRRGV